MLLFIGRYRHTPLDLKRMVAQKKIFYSTEYMVASVIQVSSRSYIGAGTKDKKLLSEKNAEYLSEIKG